MKSPMQDPNHWRERAEETRAKADGFLISKAEKERLLKIAEEYDRLASMAASRGKQAQLGTVN